LTAASVTTSSDVEAGPWGQSTLNGCVDGLFDGDGLDARSPVWSGTSGDMPT
jgi:hypothetical protein